MKKRIVAFLCALAVFATTPGAIPLSGVKASEVSETGTTYYISSKNGDNKNTGTAQNQAWQTLDKLESVVGTLKPGDKILLEKGSVFHGYIHLKDVQGTKENPIVIGSYGDSENKPIINTDGQGIWYQDYGQALDNEQHKYNGYVSSSILLYDVDYVTVQGLELTNQAENVENFVGDKSYFDWEDTTNVSKRMDRTGVAGIAKDGGTMQGITLKDLSIHDVDGNLQDKHMNNGGIQMNVLKPSNESTTGIARYQDILIEGCHVKEVSRAGICIGYTYQSAKFKGSAISDATAQKYGHGNVVVRNNYVQNISNDGIVVMYADRPLVENNVADKVGLDVAKQYFDWQNLCCGIWPWRCKNAIFQRNEAFDTEGTHNADGQAWDIDYSDGTIYQYNYSHHNGGGALLVCLEESHRGVFRYNISQNDLNAFVTADGNPVVEVYNNVFYVGGDLSTSVHSPEAGKRDGAANFTNNIFYNESTNKPADEHWSENNRYTFSNNLYYGYATQPAGDAAKVVVTEGTKVFEDPGKAPTSTTGSIHELSAFNGYQLAENSPAINKGKFVAVINDFFGNKVGMIPDIGIHETTTPEEADLIVVSNLFNVGTTQDTITAVPYGTTVKALKEGLVYPSGVTLKVTAADGTEKTDVDVLESGYKVVITKGSDEKTYTLTVDAEVVAVTSLVYSVAEAAIGNVPTNTTVKTFLSNLKYQEGFQVEVFAGEQKVAETEKVAEGNTLKVTGKSGTTKTYTLHIVKVYREYDVAGMSAEAGSVQSGQEAGKALDNNTGTLWHTNWNSDKRENLWISIDMGSKKDVSMLKYVPRSTGGVNGIITKYKILTSDDKQTWTPVTLISSDVWAGDSTEKYAYFENVNARYVKLMAVESMSQNDGQIFATAVEIRLGYEVVEE